MSDLLGRSKGTLLIILVGLLALTSSGCRAHRPVGDALAAYEDACLRLRVGITGDNFIALHRKTLRPLLQAAKAAGGGPVIDSLDDATFDYDRYCEILEKGEPAIRMNIVATDKPYAGQGLLRDAEQHVIEAGNQYDQVR